MDIQALKLRVTEAEVNELLNRYPPEGGSVENLRVRLSPAGVTVQGDYPALMMRVSFETLWEVAAVGATLTVRLAHVKVAGLPAGVLRGVLLRMARDWAVGRPGFRLDEDTMHVHLEQAAGAQGVPLRVHFSAVRCGDGWLTVEAGSAS